MSAQSQHLIEWKEAYYVGVARFDGEHVELMELANAIIAAIDGAASPQAIEEAFTALLDRTCRHFDDEESIMGQTFYSHLAQHRANHNELVRSLVGYAAKSRLSPVSAAQAGQFLLDWLLEHVMQADVYYAKHFKDRGLA